MRFNLQATQKPASIKADAAGGKKLATFEMVAYNGGPMTPEGWANPVICDLAGFKINSQNRPILRQHDSNKIVGHSTRISVGAGQPLKISGVISGVGPDAQEVVGAPIILIIFLLGRPGEVSYVDLLAS